MLQFIDSTMNIGCISIISCYLMGWSHECKGRYELIVDSRYLLNLPNIL
jgi:hypothetical protein